MGTVGSQTTRALAKLRLLLTREFEHEQVVTAVLPRAESAGDPREPETWPRQPVG